MYNEDEDEVAQVLGAFTAEVLELPGLKALRYVSLDDPAQDARSNEPFGIELTIDNTATGRGLLLALEHVLAELPIDGYRIHASRLSDSVALLTVEKRTTVERRVVELAVERIGAVSGILASWEHYLTCQGVS